MRWKNTLWELNSMCCKINFCWSLRRSSKVCTFTNVHISVECTLSDYLLKNTFWEAKEEKNWARFGKFWEFQTLCCKTKFCWSYLHCHLSSFLHVESLQIICKKTNFSVCHCRVGLIQISSSWILSEHVNPNLNICKYAYLVY